MLHAACVMQDRSISTCYRNTPGSITVTSIDSIERSAGQVAPVSGDGDGEMGDW